MNNYTGLTGYTHGTAPVLGILLVNLGTPDAPTPEAVRRYLAEFLSDPRVVEIPRVVWLPILHGVILRTRPKRSAHGYEKIWGAAGAPLLAISRRQAHALQQYLETRCPGPVRVALGMRYGNPSIASALEDLRRARAERVLVLPLYPQYASASTASAFDAVAATLKTWRWVPELRMVGQYHDNPDYIAAVARSIRELWDKEGEPERLLFSFHGMPKRTLLAGDPYHCQCHSTARLVAQQLGLAGGRWQISFQSRFGRETWLQPYTDKTLIALAKDGVKKVDVVCPGFAADCLETLEEIAITNRDSYLAAGGEQFRYIPALNDRPDHITVLADIVMRHVQGWPEAESEWNASRVAAAWEESRRRAFVLGADQ